MMIFFLLLGLKTVIGLQCYACLNTETQVERFTKEVREVLQCSNDPRDWSIVTCEDKLEFCQYTSFREGYNTYHIYRGCGIPKG